MVKKLLILGVALIMAFSLWACETKVPYNAVIFGRVYENRTWLNDDFYESNLTYGSFSSAIEDYIKDEAYPPYRTKIIVDKAEFDTVFKEFPIEVNFEQKMVLLHGFSTHASRDHEIKSIRINNDINTIYVEYGVVKVKLVPPNATQKMTKWIVVVLDKIDITTAEFALG